MLKKQTYVAVVATSRLSCYKRQFFTLTIRDWQGKHLAVANAFWKTKHHDELLVWGHESQEDQDQGLSDQGQGQNQGLRFCL